MVRADVVGASPPPRRWRSCVGKVTYGGPGPALAAVAEIVAAGRHEPHRGRMTAYVCQYCRGWHVGHTAAWLDIGPRSMTDDESRMILDWRNMSVVIANAKKYHGRLSVKEAIQEGVVGLGRAIVEKDWGCEASLRTYAQHKIRGEIRKAAADCRVVKVPAEAFQRRHGAANYKAKTREAAKLAEHVVPVLPHMRTSRPSPQLAAVEKAEAAEAVRKAMGELPELERRIVLAKIGGQAFWEIAKRLGTSTTTCRMLYNGAAARLREMLAPYA